MTKHTSERPPGIKDPLAADLPTTEEFLHTKRVSNYLIGKVIGKGAFATVNEGLHSLTTEKVAVKVINKSLCNKDNYVKRHLRREGKILQQLRHPNIIHLLEIMETDNSIYLIMELCHCNLMTRILKKKRLSEEETRVYMRQLILAVDYLHSLCIMHRDLKVENLLLTSEDVLKVADFGVSNQLSNTKNLTAGNPLHGEDAINYQQHLCKTHCGSPAYAAPEVLSRSLYEYSADVWSIGINMFAMLTGKLPFTVKPFNIQELKDKMLAGDMNTLPDDITTETKHLLLLFLNPDPHKRVTLRDAMQNSWFHTENSAHCNHGTSTPDINSALIKYMDDHLGFQKSDTIKSVMHKLPHSSHATYHLLMKKAQRYCASEQISLSKWLYSNCSHTDRNREERTVQELSPLNEITNANAETFTDKICNNATRNSKMSNDAIQKFINHTGKNHVSMTATSNISAKRSSISFISTKSTLKLNPKSNKLPANSRLLPHINEINIPYFTQITQSKRQASSLFTSPKALTTMPTYIHRRLSMIDDSWSLSKSRLQSSLLKRNGEHCEQGLLNAECDQTRRFSVGSTIKNYYSSLNK